MTLNDFKTSKHMPHELIVVDKQGVVIYDGPYDKKYDDTKIIKLKTKICIICEKR